MAAPPAVTPQTFLKGLNTYFKTAAQKDMSKKGLLEIAAQQASLLLPAHPEMCPPTWATLSLNQTSPGSFCRLLLLPTLAMLAAAPLSWILSIIQQRAWGLPQNSWIKHT